MAKITETISEDHRAIRNAYEQVVSAKDADSIDRWRNQFVWQLARHSIGEELVVYPAMEKHLGAEGHKLAQNDRDQHQVVKEELIHLQGINANDSNLIKSIKSIMDTLEQHIEEEETNDLPKLEKAMAEDENESLAKSFVRTKAFVPSRSHPNAPNKPPFETAIGLLTAPIDHIGDLFRKFPDEIVSPNPSTK